MQKHFFGPFGGLIVVAVVVGGSLLNSTPPIEIPSDTPEVITFVDTTEQIKGVTDVFQKQVQATPEPTAANTAGNATVQPASTSLVNSQVQSVSTPTPTPTSTPTPSPTPSATPAQLVSASQIITLVNAERSRAGVPPLATNPLLNTSAQVVSDHHVALKYTGHSAPDGKEPFFSVKQVGYTYAAIGENLAYMTPGLSASAVVSEWMKSASHKETLLSRDFLEAGVGITYGPVTINGTTYAYVVAMHYGRQL